MNKRHIRRFAVDYKAAGGLCLRHFANVDPFRIIDGGEKLVGREADAVWRFSPAEACFEIKYISTKAQEIGAGK